MGFKPTFIVSCDDKNCDAIVVHLLPPNTTEEDCVNTAKKSGWTRLNGLVLCPKHKRETEEAELKKGWDFLRG